MMRAMKFCSCGVFVAGSNGMSRERATVEEQAGDRGRVL